jgi:tetratricopeptide (TPR) repeat protein
LGCPDENFLAAFLEGSLTERESAQVEAHLELCPACRSLVSLLAPSVAPGTLGHGVAFSREDQPSSQPTSQTPSQTLAQSRRFEILRELGSGSMGTVYEAREQASGCPVALKVLRSQSPTELLRFKRAYRAVAPIRHPNLVGLHELGWLDLGWYFTMDLVEGLDLVASLGYEPSRREARLRTSIFGLTEGLLALHGSGKVHRDVKPSNVLVTPDGHVVVLDFGLVADVLPDLRPGPRPEDLAFAGTVAYMAPEQAASRPPSAASDLYAVGAILYQALTGQPPFKGDPYRVLAEKQETDPPPPGALRPGVPEDLGSICMELLRRDPGARPGGLEVLRRLHAEKPGLHARPSIYRLAAPQGQTLLGREAELGRLRRGFDDSRARGAARWLLVTGPSGIGKSALVHHFLAERSQADPDLIALRGRCREHEQVPYNAFDGLVDELSSALCRWPRKRLEPLLPENLSELTALFPVLGRLQAEWSQRAEPWERLAHLACPDGSSIDPAEQRKPEPAASPPGSKDPAERRTRAFSILSALLARLSRSVPLIISLDDLQWADADSLELLSALSRATAEAPILFVTAIRSEAPRALEILDRLIGSQAASRSFDQLELAPLSARDSKLLAESLLSDSPLAESLLADSPLADSPLAESLLAESPLAESPLAECLLADSPLAESLLADSPLAESLLGSAASGGVRHALTSVLEEAKGNPFLLRHLVQYLAQGGGQLLAQGGGQLLSSRPSTHESRERPDATLTPTSDDTVQAHTSDDTLQAHTSDDTLQAPASDDTTPLQSTSEAHTQSVSAVPPHDLPMASPGALALDRLISLQLDALPAQTRQLIELLCVAGEAIPRALLRQAAEFLPGHAYWVFGMADLAAQGLLKEQGLREPDPVEPYHDRIREQVAQTLTEPRRTELHRRLALAYEALAPTEVERLTRHWTSAGDPGRALHHSRLAAQAALGKLAFDRAAQHIRAALALSSDPADRAALGEKLGDALMNAGRPADAAEAYEAAAREAQPDQRLVLLQRAAKQWLTGGYLDRGKAVLGEVMHRMGVSMPKTPAASMRSVLWNQLRLRLRGSGYRIIQTKEVPRHLLERLDLYYTVGQGFINVDVLLGVDFLTRHMLLALETGEPSALASAFNMEAMSRVAVDITKIPWAKRRLKHAVDLALSNDDETALATSISISGVLDLYAGEWEKASQQMISAEERYLRSCHGVQFEKSSTRWFLCLSLCRQGRLRELAERHERYLDESHRLGDRFALTNFQAFFNPLWLVRDDPDRSASTLEGLLDTWPRDRYVTQHFMHTTSVTERLIYLGQGRAAWDAMRRDEKRLTRSMILKSGVLRTAHLWILGRAAVCAAAEVSASASSSSGSSFALPAERALYLARAARIAIALGAEGLPFTTAWASLLTAGILRLVSATDGAASARATPPPSSPSAISSAVRLALAHAVAKLDAAGCRDTAAAARRHLGLLQGGPEGAALVAQADAFLLSEGVVSPARFAAWLAPGF